MVVARTRSEELRAGSGQFVLRHCSDPLPLAQGHSHYGVWCVYAQCMCLTLI
jgi:hypothetical protein